MNTNSVLIKLANAMKYCKECGTLFRADQKTCSYCRSEEFEEDEEKVLERIINDPFLKESIA